VNNPQRTRLPRAAQAVKPARDARARIATRAEFARIIAAQPDLIAPRTTRVRTVPVTRDGRRRTRETLDDLTGRPGAPAPDARRRRRRTWLAPHGVAGRPADAAADAHRAALGLLPAALPVADWDRPRRYDATTGVLALDEPTAPAALGLDTAEEANA